jgi:hypothetical protein
MKSFKHLREKTEQLDELSSEMLGRYKKGASQQATAADASGNFKKADKRFSGIIKATKKQFSNDMKKYQKENIEIENPTDAGRSLVHKPNKEPMTKIKTKTPLTESRKAEIVKEIVKGKKKKKNNEVSLAGGEKFQPEPVLTSQIVKEDK